MTDKKEKPLKDQVILGSDGHYYEVRRLIHAKLKDKEGRGGITVDLRKLGYVPDLLVVQKIQGQNNHVGVSALIMKEGVKNEK